MTLTGFKLIEPEQHAVGFGRSFVFFDDVSHSLPARVQTAQIKATPATGKYTYRNVTLCRYFNIQPRMLFSPNHSNENSVAGATASDDVQRSVAIAIQCAQVDPR